MLLRSAMHVIPFHLKRAWHCTLAHLRRLAKPYDITPARFDLLHLVGNYGSPAQADLHKALGVSRATTSRMLISLEKLGLIGRRHTYGARKRINRRNYIVVLTDKARQILRAIRMSVIAPWIQLAFECFFLAQGWGPIRAFWDVDKLSCDLHEIAQHFGDMSEHNYQLDPEPDPDGELVEFLADLGAAADPRDIIPLKDEEHVAA